MLKGFQPEIKTFFIVAFVAVIVSVGGILLLRNDVRNQVSPTPVPAPSPQPQTTEGWQTYRNEELGVEFKYPPQHYVINEGSDYWDIYMYVPGEPKTPDKPIDPPSMIMKDHRGEVSLESYINRLDAMRGTSTEILEEKDITVGGYPSIQRIWRSIDSSVEIETFVEISSALFWRIYLYGGTEKDLQDFNDQILSTFRFVE